MIGAVSLWPTRTPEPGVFRRHRMAVIAEQVAERYGLTVADLKGRDQTHRVAHPRHEAFALIYGLRDPDNHQSPFSLPQIGRWFNRDHSTVLVGIRAHYRRSPGSFETCQTLSEPESGLA